MWPALPAGRLRRDRRPRRAAGGREPDDAGHRRLPLRARQRPVGDRRRRRLDRVLFGDLGARRDLADHGVRRLHRPRHRRRRPHLRRPRPVPAGRRRLWGSHPARARLLRLVGTVQRLGQVGKAGPAPHQRPPLLPGRLRAAVADQAGRRAPPLHGSRRVAVLQIWGWGSPARTSTTTASPRSISPARATTSSDPGRGQSVQPTRTSPSTRRQRPPSLRRRHHPSLRPGCAGSSDVNNDGFVDLFVTKGNVEAMPEFASQDPNNLLLGRPDGTFVRRRTQPGWWTWTGAGAGRSPTWTSTATWT